MTIHKKCNGNWITITESEADNHLDCITDTEKEDFAAFRNTQDQYESFADLTAAKPFIDLMVTKYGDKTFCVIYNWDGCGIKSDIYRCLDDIFIHLAFWSLDALKNQLSNENWDSQKIDVIIYPFSVLREFKNWETVFTMRFVWDLLMQL
jgi:hypothetical protein